MAGRSVTTLLNTACVFDVRPHTGSAKDYTGLHAPNWNANPLFNSEFKRGIGQVEGFDNSRATQGLAYTNTFGGITTFTMEVTCVCRTIAAVLPGSSTAIYGASGGIIFATAYAAGQAGFYFGTSLLTTANAYTLGVPVHLLISVTGGNGVWYVNGAWNAAGAVGAGTLTTLILANSAIGAGVGGMNGQIYQARIFNTSIDADEALALYESSRVRLWPGAQKRSGIVSRIV